MAKLINLNRARKAKARTVAKARASESAARFGRTKAQKKRDTQSIESADRDLDGKRRDDR